MKRVFVLGIGRSGTTLLGRLVALASTPMRFISEPFYGLVEQLSPDRVDTAFVPPLEADGIARTRDALARMAKDAEMFKSDKRFKIERDDPGGDCLVVKEVHALLAFPEVLADLDCRIAVITRDTSRVLDSYLSRDNKRYLVEEHQFLADYSRGRIAARSSLVDAALKSVAPAVERYLRRPKWMTKDHQRVVCTMEVLRHFLLAWAARDPRVVHVPYEDLCREPVPVCRETLGFLGLECDAGTEDRIREMTSGSSTGYYATDKDSRKILEQPYRKLTPADLEWIARFVAEPPAAGREGE